MELCLVAAAIGCYLAVRWYTLDRTAEAVSNAHDVLSLERALGVNWEHQIQDATMSVPGLSEFFTQFYIWAYFPTVVVVAIWLYVRNRDAYRTLRDAFLVSGVAGLVVYAVFPCAPPWTDGAGFTDTVAAGPFVSLARPSGLTNHLGAVPSFHVGWVMLVGLILFSIARSRTFRVICVLYPAAMSYAVVSTGNHWLLDVLSGAALALIGLVGGPYLTRSGLLGNRNPGSPGRALRKATEPTDSHLKFQPKQRN